MFNPELYTLYVCQRALKHAILRLETFFMKSRLFTFVFSLTAVCGSVALLVGAGKAQDPTKPPTSKEKYKNIKVLKDLPADKLIPVMRDFNSALGVKCDFCHVVDTDAAGKHIGWEKDSKPMKDMARKMIQLVHDLNKKSKVIDNKASCFMCHHGKAEPETKAPAGQIR